MHRHRSHDLSLTISSMTRMPDSINPLPGNPQKIPAPVRLRIDDRNLALRWFINNSQPELAQQTATTPEAINSKSVGFLRPSPAATEQWATVAIW
jgi:hypothetical protein